ALDVGNLRSDDQGATSIVVDPIKRTWEFREIPFQEPEVEYVKDRVRVDLSDPTKAKAHDQLEARGGAASRDRVASRSQESGKKLFQTIADSLFPGASLVASKSNGPEDVEKPLAVDLDFDVMSAVKTTEEGVRIEVPLPFPLSGTATLATRVL